MPIEHAFEKNVPQSVLIKSLVICLLLMVAGLSTLAKNGQYYPEPHPAYHVSLSAKMDVAHCHVHVAGDELDQIILFPLPQPAALSVRLHRIEVPPEVQIDVTISMQHRSPPIPLI